MIPVKQIQDAIQPMGGHQGKECYQLLYMAIYEARNGLPYHLQMQEIWAAVQTKAHKKTPAAVSKALERAVSDLWEYGDRAVLCSYQSCWGYEKPYPKDFVKVMARYLWDGTSAADITITASDIS